MGLLAPGALGLAGLASGGAHDAPLVDHRDVAHPLKPGDVVDGLRQLVQLVLQRLLTTLHLGKGLLQVGGALLGGGQGSAQHSDDGHDGEETTPSHERLPRWPGHRLRLIVARGQPLPLPRPGGGCSTGS